MVINYTARRMFGTKALLCLSFGIQFGFAWATSIANVIEEEDVPAIINALNSSDCETRKRMVDDLAGAAGRPILDVSDQRKISILQSIMEVGKMNDCVGKKQFHYSNKEAAYRAILEILKRRSLKGEHFIKSVLVPYLTQGLHEESVDVRICSAYTLGLVGPAAQDSLEDLRKALTDVMVKPHAQEAITLIERQPR